MPFDTTILPAKIEKIKEAYQNGRFGDALEGALNTGKDIMRNRIFDSNEDIEGNSFGPYIGKKSKAKFKPSASPTQNKRNKSIAGLYLTSYQRKRAKLGRQVAKKDLELTGRLRRAIETVIESEKAAQIEFNNSDAALIAHGQEQQIFNIRNGIKGTTKGLGATKIFTLNKTEKEQVVEQGAELIQQILKAK